MNSKFLSHLEKVERGELEATHFLENVYDSQEIDINWNKDLIDELRNRASGGSKICLYFLGWIYHHGLGVSSDFKKAIEYYEQSGIPAALCVLGCMYFQGQGVTRDYKKAIECYGRSNSPMALHNLGWIYYNGWGTPRNYKRAKEYFLRSKTPEAFYGLGWIYRNGSGVSQDYIKAKKYYERSGTPKALCELGDLYYNGLGVSKDYQLALHYYLEAHDTKNVTNIFINHLDEIQLSIIQNNMNSKLALSLSDTIDFSIYQLSEKGLIQILILTKLAKQQIKLETMEVDPKGKK